MVCCQAEGHDAAHLSQTVAREIMTSKAPLYESRISASGDCAMWQRCSELEAIMIRIMFPQHLMFSTDSGSFSSRQERGGAWFEQTVRLHNLYKASHADGHCERFDCRNYGGRNTRAIDLSA